VASTAYKGLTIRIGADTTSLQSALKASNRTISATQAMLRQVNKALKFDGSNAQAQAQQLKLVSARAKGLAERYTLLQRTMRQLGSSGALRKLAAETDDAAGHAQRCLERYNKVNDEIARFKHGFALKSQQGEMERLNAEIREHESLLRQMRRDYAEMGSAAPRGMLAEIKGWDASLKQLRREYRSLETAAKNAFAGVEGVDATLAKMRQMGEVTEGVEREYRALARAHAEAFGDNRLAKELVQLEQCRADAAAARAEVRALGEQMALAVRSGAANGISREFDEARESVRQCDAAIKSMQEDERKLMSAFAQNRWMDGLQDAIKSNIGRQLDSAREKAEALRRQIKALDEMGLGGIESGGQGAERALERVTQESKQAHAALAELKGRAQTVADELSRAKEGTAAYRKLEERAAAVAKRMEQLSERTETLDALLRRLGRGATLNNLVADLYKAEAAVERGTEKLSEFDRRLRMSRQTAQQLGWSMYSTVTPAVTMFAYRAISAAEEIDAAYRDMRKTVEGTEQQFEALKRGAIDYSRTHYTSADTMLEIQAMGGQLGIAADELESFSTVVSNLDIATNLNADQASEQLGQVSAILSDMKQDRGEAFPKFGDALTRLGNNAATLESNIMDVTSRIASMGTISGFTAPQLLAWATAIASTGQGSEAAGTAVAKTMSDIESAVGAGGEDLEAFAGVARMSADEFRAAWTDTPSEALRAFVQGLADIEKEGGSADSTLKQLGINSVRQKQALLGLSQTVGNVNSYIQMSDNAWEGVSDAWGRAGDAAREADAKTQGFSGAVQLLRNNFDVFGAEVGESVEGPVRALADIIGALTAGYSGLPDFAKTFVDAGIAAAAAAGPVLVFKNAAGGALKELAGPAAGSIAAGLESIGISASASSRGVRLLAASSKLAGAALRGIAPIMAIQLLWELGSAAWDAHEKMEAGARGAEELASACEAVGGISRDVARSQEEISESARSAARQVADEAYEVVQSAADTARSVKEATSGLAGDEVEVRHFDKVIREMMRVGEQGELTAVQQEMLVSAVNGYVEATGEAVSVTDLANGKLNVTSMELSNLTAKWLENAKATAAAKAVEEATAKYHELVVEQEKLKIMKEDLEKSGNDKETRYNPREGSYEQFTAEYSDILTQIENVEAEIPEAEKLMDAATRAAGRLGVGAGEAASGMGELADGADWAAAEMGEAEEAAQALASALEEALADDGNAWGSMLARAMEKSGISTDEMAQAMDAAGMSVDDLKERFAGLEQPVNTAFEKLKTESAVSAAEANANMEANKRAYDKFYSDLGKLEKQAQTDQQKAFVDYLRQSGVQNASLVEEYSKNLDLFRDGAESFDMEGVADPFNRALFRSEYGKLMEELQQYVDAIRAKAAEAVQAQEHTREEIAAAFGSAPKLTAEEALPNMDELPLYAGERGAAAGAALGVNFVAECNARAGEAQGAAQALAAAPDKPLQGAADKASEQGAAIPSGIASGIGSGQGEVQAKSEQIRQTTERSGAYKDIAFGDGYAIGSKLAAGIDSSRPLVTAAVNRLKAAANVTITGPRLSMPSGPSSGRQTVTPQRAAATPASVLAAASVPAPARVESYAAAAGVPREALAQERSYMAANGTSLQREVALSIAAEVQRGSRGASADEIGRAVGAAVARAMSSGTIRIDPAQARQMGGTYHSETNFQGVVRDDGTAAWKVMDQIMYQMELEARS